VGKLRAPQEKKPDKRKNRGTLRRAPARPAFRDRDWAPPFDPGDLGETLADLLKAQSRLVALFAAGKISARQFRVTDLALAARQRAISTRTWQENRFGNITETAKKPILVARERRIERPPPGTPPKRLTDGTGEPIATGPGRNGGPPESERKAAPEPAPTPPAPRPPRVIH
jgi:hypothetical protein